MNDEAMNREELRRLMADYLGGELPPDERDRFKRDLEQHPELAEEVRELGMALETLRSLDAEPAPAATPVIESNDVQKISGRLFRFAAMIALAFVLGYIVRGLEAPPPKAPVVAPAVPAGGPPVANSLEARYAVQYLSDHRRSGLGRALIAYARATEKPTTQGD